jgi:predicted permease
LSGLLSSFADHILPILITAAAGFLAHKLLGFSPRPLSQIAFYVLAPALVFDLLLSADIRGLQVVSMMALATIVVLSIGGFSWLLGRALGLDPKLASAVLLATAFMNAGNYGLSLNQFVYGESGLAWAGLFFVATMMLTNSLGVYSASRGRRTPLAALRELAKVPAVYAIPLALTARALDLHLPLALSRPIDLLGTATVPILLLVLGMQIGAGGASGHRGLIAVCVGLRLVVAPMVAWLVAPSLGLDGLARQVGVLESAMPTAVMSTILAIEFDVEPGFVTRVVMLTTLLSPLTLTPLIALLAS